MRNVHAQKSVRSAKQGAGRGRKDKQRDEGAGVRDGARVEEGGEGGEDAGAEERVVDVVEDDDVGCGRVGVEARVAACDGGVAAGCGDDAARRGRRDVGAHGAREGGEARARLERDDARAVHEREARERARARADLEHDGRAARAVRRRVQRARQRRAVRRRAQPAAREHRRDLREVARAQPRQSLAVAAVATVAANGRCTRTVGKRHEDCARAHA